MKPGGSSAGHNGLKHIASVLGTEGYNRLRFGIGNEFPRGMQVDFVLGRFSPEDEKLCDERALVAVEAIKAFCLSGMSFAMCHYNNK
jgi:PTH1 family peptidyl-tRNA hydrolase